MDLPLMAVAHEPFLCKACLLQARTSLSPAPAVLGRRHLELQFECLPPSDKLTPRDSTALAPSLSFWTVDYGS